jgi:hypothetical protein
VGVEVAGVEVEGVAAAAFVAVVTAVAAFDADWVALVAADCAALLTACGIVGAACALSGVE